MKVVQPFRGDHGRRRFLQKEVETPIAKKLLAAERSDGFSITVDARKDGLAIELKP